MKVLYCWRCDMEIPMLEEHEWEEIAPLMSTSSPKIAEVRKRAQESGEVLSIDDLFRPACEKFEELTGFRETNFRAIWHHRICDHGPPCENCGKPLRTNEAAFCAACGWRPNKPTEPSAAAGKRQS
jgi:hypothetical protein